MPACRSLLHRTRTPGGDYCVNPFVGCAHGCLYCYARHSRYARIRRVSSAWERAEPKAGALTVLQREVGRTRPGTVILSTATDPYQRLEEKLSVTRNVLRVLGEARFGVSILTKSDLVLRDLDVLRRFPSKRCSVGFSIATGNDSVREVLEPGAPAIERRVAALEALHSNGIRTWAFIAPILPTETAEGLRSLLTSLRGKVDHVLVDALNYRSSVLTPIVRRVRDRLGESTLTVPSNAAYLEHYQRLVEVVRTTAAELELRLFLCGGDELRRRSPR